MEKISEKDWRSRAEALFGKDPMDWAFECPSCGYVQSVRDFLPYRDNGATPNDAYQVCIGRFMGDKNEAFQGKGSGPCNYAGFGLFKLQPLAVVREDGSETPVFGFAKEQEENEG